MIFHYQDYEIIDPQKRDKKPQNQNQLKKLWSKIKPYLHIALGIAAIIIGFMLFAQILLGIILFGIGIFLVSDFMSRTRFKK